MKTVLPSISGIESLVALMIGAATARAEPPYSPAASLPAESARPWVDPPASPGSFYRTSILVADGAALAVALPVSVAAFATAPDDRMSTSLTPILALSPLALTGPIVHLTRGNGWRALASLGMRVGFFSTGTLLGGLLRAPCDFTGPCRGAMALGAIGVTMVAPALLDAFLFTSGERSASGTRARPLPSPTLHLGPDGARLGLSASF